MSNETQSAMTVTTAVAPSEEKYESTKKPMAFWLVFRKCLLFSTFSSTNSPSLFNQAKFPSHSFDFPYQF